MTCRSAGRRVHPSLFLAVLLALGALAAARGRADAGEIVRLAGHVPARRLLGRALGPVAPQTPMRLALALPARNEAALSDLLTRLFDPADPLYGQYLTPAEFTERFGPTKAQYQAVAAFAQARGLRVVGTHANRLLLDVAGMAGAVQRAFGIRLTRYLTAGGRAVRAPESDPAIPAELSGTLAGVVGLDDLAVRRPHLLREPEAAPPGPGSGPHGGMTPSDIRGAYNLPGAPTDGAGETLGLFELSGYRASDIAAYEKRFGLPAVPLQNVLIDQFDGSLQDGFDEVTLDIDLQIAMAPAATQILVYEGPNSDAGAVDTYTQIAEDNQARAVSTSWGLPEDLISPPK